MPGASSTRFDTGLEGPLCFGEAAIEPEWSRTR